MTHTRTHTHRSPIPKDIPAKGGKLFLARVSSFERSDVSNDSSASKRAEFVGSLKGIPQRELPSVHSDALIYLLHAEDAFIAMILVFPALVRSSARKERGFSIKRSASRNFAHVPRKICRNRVLRGGVAANDCRCAGAIYRRFRKHSAGGLLPAEIDSGNCEL